MAKIHTLTYNGTKSSDLGVFVTGSGSFDAAELDVDKYEIPGRNGDLILSNNRYKNIEITYPAFIPKAFMDKAQNVRNWLRSSRVYARLEDTYDTDHYRLGIPTGVQSFEPANRNDGANFEMTFDCKPQRFLKSGETPETVEADVQTESGEIVTFETVAESPMTSAEVSLSPQQDLNGYDSPWPGGGGKNLFPGPDYWEDGGITTSGQDVTGNLVRTKGFYPITGGADYVASGYTVVSASDFRIFFYDSAQNYLSYKQGNRITFTAPSNAAYFRCRWTASADMSEAQLESGSTATAYAPYSNICPISGHTGATLYVSPTTSSADATTYPVSFSSYGTVYGGTYDFVSGKLTVTRASVDLGTLTWTASSRNYFSSSSLASVIELPSSYTTTVGLLCSAYVEQTSSAIYNNTAEGIAVRSSNGNIWLYDSTFTTIADFREAMNGVQLVYPLATPIEIDLAPTEVETLLGENNVWSDAGPITLTYAEPYTIENPTQFEALPLFIITNPNQGDVLSVRGNTITFVDSYTGTVTIDCETMDCYAGFDNMNYLIEATYFPVLGEGTSIVTWSGSGECKMIPRWWEL